MKALRFVGMAILAALASCVFLIQSGTAHADFEPCSSEGTKLWGDTGPILCTREGDEPLHWVRIPAAGMCVAICDRFGPP
jgi:hypothetical protein